jgi:hypothetical protein
LHSTERLLRVLEDAPVQPFSGFVYRVVAERYRDSPLSAIALSVPEADTTPQTAFRSSFRRSLVDLTGKKLGNETQASPQYPFDAYDACFATE